MNHFFALEIHDFIRPHLKLFAKQWQQNLPSDFKASWYKPEDYHITLKFLGHVSEPKQLSLIEAALPIASLMKPFWIDIVRYGAFPNLKRPNVLWVGIRYRKALTRLAFQLDKAIHPLGFPIEKQAFKPHITLAHCQTKNEDASLPGAFPSEPMFSSFIVDHFVLMQTLLPGERRKEEKARYNIVHTFPFGKS